MTIATKIYREFEKQNGLTLDELHERIPDVLIGDLDYALIEQIDRGFIKLENGVYRARFLLLHYTKKSKLPKASTQAVIYEDIQKKKAERKLQGAQEASTTLTAFMNPHIKHVVHQGQGKTGTCVGQSEAYGANINYIQLTGDIPTDEDWQYVKFNVKFDPANPNSTTYYDVLLPKSFAAAFAYWRSRVKCNITEPSGSYVSCAVLSWAEEGICLNDQWYLSKDGRTTWRDPYPDVHPITKERAFDFARKHKISGSARITSAQGVRDAIAKYGFVLGAIEVYENYNQVDPKTGIFPDPKGDSVGGHALCFIGYDANYLYCLHSWRDELPAKIGGISWSYFNVGAIEFFTILDDEESKIIIAPPTPPVVPPVAKIEATPVAGQVPLLVQFFDRSDGTVGNRSWNFGDGSDLSSLIAPSHTYQAVGPFTAQLDVRNEGGASTARLIITVTPPPIHPPTPWEQFVAWMIAMWNAIFGR